MEHIYKAVTHKVQLIRHIDSRHSNPAGWIQAQCTFAAILMFELAFAKWIYNLEQNKFVDSNEEIWESWNKKMRKFCIEWNAFFVTDVDATKTTRKIGNDSGITEFSTKRYIFDIPNGSRACKRKRCSRWGRGRGGSFLFEANSDPFGSPCATSSDSVGFVNFNVSDRSVSTNPDWQSFGTGARGKWKHFRFDGSRRAEPRGL